MANVTIKINNRPYGIACDDGQETRVMELAGYIDKQVTQIAQAGSASTEAHLLVLSSIIMADEISELQASIEALQEQMERATSNALAENAGLSEQDGNIMSAAIHNLTERVEHLSHRIKQAA